MVVPFLDMATGDDIAAWPLVSGSMEMHQTSCDHPDRLPSETTHGGGDGDAARSFAMASLSARRS
jgi:hypothetical protein